MLHFFDYVVKLSGTLVIVYLFYQVVLRQLTFYTANRWYLLLYPMAAFVIPFIDINPFLEKAEITDGDLVNWVPLVNGNGLQTGANIASGSIEMLSTILLVVFGTGVVFMIIRLLIQVISFRSLRKSAQLVSGDGVKIYHTPKSIVPFSFGDSIFLNMDTHNDEDLHKIIRHEFIHVKEKHTIDIIISEFICILNWYNPFAWLIRHAIRQNLEFIADKKVLENGIDKKQYQYLLLKVVGSRPYRIATNFNFTSLKTRIAMMNKIRSAKVHVLKFLFVLPVLAVILLAFRKSANPRATDARTISGSDFFEEKPASTGLVQDTVPAPAKASVHERPLSVATANTKGYTITIADDNGEAIVIVRDKQQRIVKATSLVDWNTHEKENVSRYGDIPTPPIPPAPPAAPDAPVKAENVASMHVKDNKVTMILKTGDTETFDLNKPEEKAKFRSRYMEDEASVNGPEQPVNKSNTGIIIDNKVNPSKPIIDRPKPGDSPVQINNDDNQQTYSVETSGNVVIKKDPEFEGLYIVDGKDYNKKAFEELKLKPNTIKRIDVLKGEKAVEIYGEKGKNGVINITTRKDSAQ